jgi:hypothetical protein|tara:strand:- start:65 stop:241 length:177 start_codon:yes stop_codon:yes gene_type:complete
MITREAGFGWVIIGSAAFSLDDNTVVSYPDDTPVQRFDTEALMNRAHRAQFPEQYIDD